VKEEELLKTRLILALLTSRSSGRALWESGAAYIGGCLLLALTVWISSG